MEDLWTFKEEVLFWDANWQTAISYLDLQTRTDYFNTQGEEIPNIFKYIMSYKNWDGKYEQQ